MFHLIWTRFQKFFTYFCYDFSIHQQTLGEKKYSPLNLYYLTKLKGRRRRRERIKKMKTKTMTIVITMTKKKGKTASKENE